jgi:hypothetical protein
MGTHGPECTCPPPGEVTVATWVALHGETTGGADDALTYSAATVSLYLDQRLPQMMLYTMNATTAAHPPGWKPTSEDVSALVAQQQLLEHAEIAAALGEVQRLYEIGGNVTTSDEAEIAADAIYATVYHPDASKKAIWWLACLTSDLCYSAMERLTELERYVWADLVDRPFDRAAQPILPHPHVAVAAARIVGAIADGREEDLADLWERYGEDGLSGMITALCVNEIAARGTPGVAPNVMAMERDGTPAYILDLETAAGQPQHRPLVLATRWVQSVCDGEPFDLGAAADEAADVLGHVSLILAQSYTMIMRGEHLRYRSDHPENVGSPDL